jgi:hypothetical protein
MPTYPEGSEIREPQKRGTRIVLFLCPIFLCPASRGEISEVLARDVLHDLPLADSIVGTGVAALTGLRGLRYQRSGKK